MAANAYYFCEEDAHAFIHLAWTQGNGNVLCHAARVCGICSTRFSSAERLLHHVRTHHPGIYFAIAKTSPPQGPVQANYHHAAPVPINFHHAAPVPVNHHHAAPVQVNHHHAAPIPVNHPHAGPASMNQNPLYIQQHNVHHNYQQGGFGSAVLLNSTVNTV
jgi:hypothetical protein